MMALLNYFKALVGWAEDIAVLCRITFAHTNLFIKRIPCNHQGERDEKYALHCSSILAQPYYYSEI